MQAAYINMSNSTKILTVAILASLAACVTPNPELIQNAPSAAVPPPSGDTAAPIPDLQEVNLQNIEAKEIPLANNTGSPDEMVCRRERVTGSHMPVRICRTRAQADAEQRGAQEFLRQVGSVQGEGESAE
ncbi:uncharacterized protein METZ01_LOCUS120731 [marine metagenome]|uniref:Uncharacterized protein n=1 Tax=marine metagenome TaxID=408172 RepID=A0A381XUI6_9ZZZZ